MHETERRDWVWVCTVQPCLTLQPETVQYQFLIYKHQKIAEKSAVFCNQEQESYSSQLSLSPQQTQNKEPCCRREAARYFMSASIELQQYNTSSAIFCYYM